MRLFWPAFFVLLMIWNGCARDRSLPSGPLLPNMDTQVYGALGSARRSLDAFDKWERINHVEIDEDKDISVPAYAARKSAEVELNELLSRLKVYHLKPTVEKKNGIEFSLRTLAESVEEVDRWTGPVP